MPLTQRIRLHVHPVDRVITGLLLISVAIGCVFCSAAEQRVLLLIHIGLLSVYVLFVAAAARLSNMWVVYTRPLLAAAIIFTLYTTLGRLGMITMPYRGDGWLSRIDTFLFFGNDPALAIQRWQTAQHVEFFAIFYALFIPYINLSLLLGACGRPPVERDVFLTGWIFTYALSYVGYLLLPATGPGAFQAGQFTVELHGGFFLQTVLTSVGHSGGMVGAFPSLHVGSSLYLCLFDLRTNRLRGLTYLPLVVLIYGATVFLRFHYVIDLIVGTMIAYACLRLGPWAFYRWARARQAAGLPALPGGEGDVLPHVSNAGVDRAADVLPAH